MCHTQASVESPLTFFVTLQGWIGYRDMDVSTSWGSLVRVQYRPPFTTRLIPNSWALPLGAARGHRGRFSDEPFITRRPRCPRSRMPCPWGPETRPRWRGSTYDLAPHRYDHRISRFPLGVARNSPARRASARLGATRCPRPPPPLRSRHPAPPAVGGKSTDKTPRPRSASMQAGEPRLQPCV